MLQTSWFRGLGGEIVRGLLTPFSLLAAFPLAILFALLPWLGSFLGTVGSWLAPLLGTILWLANTGRHALGTRHGEDDTCEERQLLGGFVLRAGLLNLLWVAPAGLLLFLTRPKATVIGDLGAVEVGATAKPAVAGIPGLLTGTGTFGLALLGCLLAAGLLVPLFLMQATRYDRPGELLTLAHWRWLFKERRGDLAPCYALCYGGLFCFCLLYAVPLLFLGLLVQKGAFWLGSTLASCASLLPLAAASSLLGRLSGAFVASEAVPVEKPATVAKHKTKDEPQQPLQGVKGEGKPDLAAIRARIDVTPPWVVDKALADAYARREEQPLAMSLEIALLAKRGENLPAALPAACDAIALALQASYNDLALAVYREFREERQRFTLASQPMERLSELLQRQRAFSDAAWCACAGAQAAGDLRRAQKRLYLIAQEAEGAGNREEARTLYDYFLRTFPDAPLQEYVRQALKRLAE